MIAIKVELWPYGDRKRAKPIGLCLIANDGTGTEQVGNYKAVFKTEKEEFNSEVKDFPRLRLNAFDLLYRALAGAVGGRK